MRKRLLVLAMVVLAGVVSLAAPQKDVERLDGSSITPDEIDGTVTRVMKAAEVPGVGLAVINSGEIAYLKAYGVRDKEKSLPETVDSVVHAASFTKVAFAYMAMQLVDKGRLDLDKPVYQYLPKSLPEYPNYTDLAGDPRYQRITARMLLSHTSGFPNWRAFEDDRKLKIHFEPGSRYAYSGEGLILLQLVIETIMQQPLEELMQQYVFLPFGMTRTSMVWQDRFDSDHAIGYDEYGRPLGAEARKHADAAGSMNTTLRDFARFMQAVLKGEGLSEKAREQMLSPQIQILTKHEFPTFENQTTDENRPIRLSYGLGWGLYWTPYGRAFFKEGHADGWRNYAVCFDKKGAGIVIMTNSGNGEGIYKEILERVQGNTFTPIVWEGFNPCNQLPPRAPLPQHTQVRVDPTVLEKYVGRYGEPPNLILTVRRDGDHLSVQENDEPKQDVFPESEKDFFSKVSDDVLTFESDRQGHIITMVIYAGGRDIPIKRIYP
jgi:CubicO group peptidase (beta-lactamase class C family)